MLVEFLVGGGQDAHVDRDGLVGADRLDALLFERAQDLGLGAQAHVADFVEEKRAAVGLLELADLVFGGAGEAAFDVAEQFGLDQLFGDGGAIHFDERLGAAQAGGVQGARDEFLAGAAFAIDEHAAVGGRGQGDLLAHGLHGNALADDVVARAEFLAQAAVFLFEAQEVDGLAHGERGGLERKRFFDEIEGAEFGGAHGGLDAGMAGDHHDHGQLPALAHEFERAEAVQAWQPDVEKHDVHRAAREPGQALFAAGHGFDGVALFGQDGGEGRADAFFVVDDEDGMGHGGQASCASAAAGSMAGSSMMKRVPTGTLSSARINP